MHWWALKTSRDMPTQQWLNTKQALGGIVYSARLDDLDELELQDHTPMAPQGVRLLVSETPLQQYFMVHWVHFPHRCTPPPLTHLPPQPPWQTPQHSQRQPYAPAAVGSNQAR
jgi:hypothetical protein